MTNKGGAERTVREIRKSARRRYSVDGTTRIALGGLRGGGSIAELCRHKGINNNVYYRWSKELLDAGKKHLSSDILA